MSQPHPTAPIPYGEVRFPYQTARAAGAGAFAILSAFAISLEVPFAWAYLMVSIIVLLDAIIRRHIGDTPQFSLIIDVTAIGVALLVQTNAAFTTVGAMAYIVTACMLMLPLLRALITVAYAGLLIFAGVAVSTVLPEAGRVEVGTTLDRVAMAMFLALSGLLLWVVGRIIHRLQVRHSEALAVERRANELKNEFVSMVSHELRTPLTSIAGFTDMLRDSWADLDDEEVDEFLRIMREEAGHLSNLVEDILVIPRLESGRLRLDADEFDLRDEAYQVARLVFGQGEPKEAEVSIPGGIVVRADRVRTRQVLRNLLENARKYGGDQVLVEGEPSGDAYKVIVSDNGKGIPEGTEDRIFEEFEQASKGDAREQQGIGLGLPIARKLVRAMGGELWYESRFPTGAQFCFTVAIATDAPGATATAYQRLGAGEPRLDSVPN